MTAILRGLRVNAVAFVDKGAGKGVRITLFKRREAGESAMPKQKVEKAKTLDEVLEKLDDDEKKLVQDAISAKKAEDEEPAEKADEEEEPAEKAEDDEEEAMKRLPASLRKRLAEADSLRAELAKAKDAEEKREFVAKAAEFGTGLPGLSTEDLGEALRCLSKKRALSEDLAKKLEGSLRNASELIAKSELLKERGSAGAGRSESSAFGELKLIAKKIRDEQPSLTDEQAFAKAYDLNPDIVRRHDAEIRGV